MGKSTSPPFLSKHFEIQRIKLNPQEGCQVCSKEKIEGIQARVSICKDVIEAIFDECDKNNIDETGGRIIGYYHQDEDKLHIKACG